MHVPLRLRGWVDRGARNCVFCIAALTVWNSLSSSIRSSTSAHTFRCLLETHCFQLPPSGSAKCPRFGHWPTLCTINILLTYLLIYCADVQIMKKMRDEAAGKSPGGSAGAGASNLNLTSPALNSTTEMMNNITSSLVRRQNSAPLATGKDDMMRATSDMSASAAATRQDCVSDRTSDPSVSEASVSLIYLPLIIILHDFCHLFLLCPFILCFCVAF